MRVGLCLEGSKTHRNDAMRSIPKGMIAPLATVPGITWVSLMQSWTPDMGEAGLINGLPANGDWLDTARALLGWPGGRDTPPAPDEKLEPLDLVITVDTAIAHLAGGLGIPVWILLAAVPDMRWGLDSTTTPWYTSARLYRQRVAGEWGPVIEEVTHALQHLAHPHVGAWHPSEPG